MSRLPSDDRKLLANPFGRVVGLPLNDDEVDVPEINREAFESCRRLVEDVRNQHASSSLTLFGDVGSGKTHLLGRVRRWLEAEPDALFILAPMDTDAKMLWRHLRRCLADALLRNAASGQRHVDRLLDGRQAELQHTPERDLGIVLEMLLRGNHLRDAAAWLRGQELPEAALTRLDVTQPGPDEDQEAAARDVVVSLCQLIEPAVVVFCLDQLEALQGFQGDTEGLFAAGKAVWVLHDKVGNACVISCVQTDFLPSLEKVPEWLRDRMRGKQGIRLLDWEQARRLIAARLASVPALAKLRREQTDSLWPLEQELIRRVFVANAAPARKVIACCKELFDQWRTGDAPRVAPIGDALQEMLEERIMPVEPVDAEAAFRNGLPIMFGALKATSATPQKGSPFDFVLHNGRQMVALCNQANGRSLAARLKKVDEGWRPATGQRLLILRDARLPIGPTARVTKERLHALKENGAYFVSVSQEAVEALAALRRLLADAQSGDLAHRGDSIQVSTVEQWIAGHLPSALDPLIAEIGAPHELSARLADLLAKRKIVHIQAAALELEADPREVESCARRDPRLFGWLGGKTPALFQPVEAERLQPELR